MTVVHDMILGKSGEAMPLNQNLVFQRPEPPSIFNRAASKTQSEFFARFSSEGSLGAFFLLLDTFPTSAKAGKSSSLQRSSTLRGKPPRI
jgi:hypothetical protein